MLTKAPIGRSPDADSGNRWAALAVAVAAAAALVWVVVDAFRATWIDLDGPAAGLHRGLRREPLPALGAALRGAVRPAARRAGRRDRPVPQAGAGPRGGPKNGPPHRRPGERSSADAPRLPAVLAALLFCTGLYGVLARRNAILVLMSVELMLNAVNLNLVAFDVWLARHPARRPGAHPLHHRHRRRRDRHRPGDRAARLPQPRHRRHRPAPRHRRGPDDDDRGRRHPTATPPRPGRTEKAEATA